MQHPPTKQAFGPSVCRIADVMAHSKHLAFRGTTRLAFLAGVSPASISRIVNGKLNPSAAMLGRIASALEIDLGIPIDPRELIAEYGQFPTRFVCDLVGCPGCLPDNAYDEFGDKKPAYSNVKPGEWVTSRHPKGFAWGKDDHA